MKLKLPNLPKLQKLRTFSWPQSKSRVQPRLRPPTRLNAATRRAAPPAFDDYPYEEQPTTKLSSAFFVVLILHVVAVGGIYAFNSIKAHRRNREVPAPIAQDNAATQRPGMTAERAEPAAAAMTASANARNTPAMSPVATSGAHTLTTAKMATPKPATTTDPKKSEFLAHRNEDAAMLKPPVKANTAEKPYKVLKGDTVYSIARKFGVSAEELMKANKIEDSKKLQIAQVLKVPAKKPE